MFGKNTFQFNFIVRVLTKREKKKETRNGTLDIYRK